MVIVLDKHKRPAGFTTPRRARLLLDKGRAVVHKVYPFTIRVKDIDSREFDTRSEYQIKIDPGSKHTGIAIIEQGTNKVCMFIQIEHRGDIVKMNLDTRRGARRNRRNRETRYRRCKFPNKKGQKNTFTSSRPEGWLPPSVKSVGDNIINWFKKLCSLINITSASLELVKFDTQLMDNPDISGVEYQQGTLAGYELRSYIMEKYNHTCQYCGGASGDSRNEIEHITSKHNGGTNKEENLTVACHKCNSKKGNLNLDQWLEQLKAKENPSELDKTRIKLITDFLAGHPLQHKNYAAWANSLRFYILNNITVETEIGTGGQTAYNRKKLNINKDHHLDALCVATVPDRFYNLNQPVLYVKAMGRGTRLRGNTNACGIITNKFKDNSKRVFKFQTGDIVKANITKGKKIGEYIGRITTTKQGYFLLVGKERVTGVKHTYCKILQHGDGYNYTIGQPTTNK